MDAPTTDEYAVQRIVEAMESEHFDIDIDVSSLRTGSREMSPSHGRFLGPPSSARFDLATGGAVPAAIG